MNVYCGYRLSCFSGCHDFLYKKYFNVSEFGIFCHFYVRLQVHAVANLSYRNSVCLSVCHTGGSVKNDTS